MNFIVWNNLIQRKKNFFNSLTSHESSLNKSQAIIIIKLLSNCTKNDINFWRVQIRKQINASLFHVLCVQTDCELIQHTDAETESLL